MAARMPIIATTINSSMRVNALLVFTMIGYPDLLGYGIVTSFILLVNSVFLILDTGRNSLHMPTGNQIRTRLHSGEMSYGTHVSSEGCLSGLTGLQADTIDFVFIDTEHTPVDRVEVSGMCHRVSTMGFAPVVRITHPDGILACQALDAGAHGIVAPYVETEEQVKDVAGAVRYRPLKGKQRADVVNGARPLNDKTHQYLEQWNQNAFLLIGIESMAAVEALPSLLVTPGVDGVFIGPHDLSISLGIPEAYDSPKFTGAVCSIIHQARQAHMGAGMHIKTHHRNKAVLTPWLDAGLNWILYSHDFELFRQSLENDLTFFRSLKGT